MSNLTTVKAIYEAFGRGDVPAILDVIADDCEWEAWSDNSAVKAGVPWLQPRVGKAGVAEFFSVVGQMEIVDFQVLSLMDGGEQVAGRQRVTWSGKTSAGAWLRGTFSYVLETTDAAGNSSRSQRHHVRVL